MNKGNTPLEVMAAIVANGGPVLAWVKYQEHDEWSDYTVNITGVDLDGHGFCSLTDPNPQYKPIPTEWINDWAEWRAIDPDGRLFEYKTRPYAGKTAGEAKEWLVNNKYYSPISGGHDPTNWEDSLEQRPRKKRPMTPLEAYEFLAEGCEGKPRVWRYIDEPKHQFTSFTDWWHLCNVENKLYANLSDRDGETLIWREFPMVEDKT